MELSISSVFQQKNWAREHGGPLYVQLREHIEKTIRSGQLSSGVQLPSEREIAELSEVSRITVRKAVQELVHLGLVIQKQGFGTTIAGPVKRVEQSLTSLTSFTEDMARRGMEVQSTFIEKGLFKPSPKEIVALGLKSTEMVARIARLRSANGVPLAIERAALSAKYIPDPESVGASLYTFLKRSGNQPSRAIQRISASNLNTEDASLLAVPCNEASLNIERISYLETGQIVEFTRSIYRGDAYDFVAELQISQSDNS